MQAIKSNLAHLLPLLKEANAQAQTGMSLLSSDKPEDKDKIREQYQHFLLRTAGKVERDDSMVLAEVMCDALVAMVSLDAMWVFSSPSSIRFMTESYVLTLEPQDMLKVMLDAANARAQLFAIRTALAVDETGDVSLAMYRSLIGSTTLMHKQYCEVLLSLLPDTPF